jgi:hypothetical protein
MFTNLILVALVQNAMLIQSDINNTKYLVQNVFHNNCEYEANPVARIFWQNNKWAEGYLAAIALNYIGSELLLHIDKSGLASYIFSDLIAIAEIFAINSWNLSYPYIKDSYNPWSGHVKGVYAEAKILIIQF